MNKKRVKILPMDAQPGKLLTLEAVLAPLDKRLDIPPVRCAAAGAPR